MFARRCTGGAPAAKERTAAATTVLLWSFPGSGNTWARLLLEAATGLPSGSVFNDSSLAGVLPAELRGVATAEACAALVCVKNHVPWTATSGPLRSLWLGSDSAKLGSGWL